jgi:hypothetical protein
MANELRVQTQTSYAQGNANLPARSVAKGVTVTGTLVTSGVISIGTSETQIPTLGFTLNGFIQFTNLDNTNYVEFGGSTGVYPGRANAGEPALLRMNTWTGVYAKANTAACLVEFRIFSN